MNCRWSNSIPVLKKHKVVVVSIGMVGAVISTPRLNTLRHLHLEPMCVVVFHETYTLSWGGLRA